MAGFLRSHSYTALCYSLRNGNEDTSDKEIETDLGKPVMKDAGKEEIREKSTTSPIYSPFFISNPAHPNLVFWKASEIQIGTWIQTPCSSLVSSHIHYVT